MGREASSPPWAAATAANGVAGSSSSGHKRKAAVDDDGRGEDDNWLKLSLAPVDYGDATGDVVDNNSSSCAPAVMTSTEERSGTAAGVASGSARAGLIPNGAVPVFPCFNFLGTSMSSSSLSHLHQQSSSTRRQSNASTASSSGGIGGGDDDEAPNVMNGGDKNDGNALPDPPYPWATNEVAKHHSLVELARRDIININGEARCRRCDTRKMIVYNIATKFREVSDYFRQNYQHMNDRAQARWMNPVVPNCDSCGHERCMRPVIAAEKERINWLFLLLGETLGLCTLDQLKYFCAHTNRHRTGAKDRVLFSTYEELCNQLAPGLIMGHDQLRMLMTSTEERPATAAYVASRSARTGLIPNGAVPVFPCFNFLGTSTSSSSLSHLHQQSSSTLRQSNVSMASSSGIGGGDDNEAPGNIVAPNVPNSGSNDNNGGNAPPDPPYPWDTNKAAKHHSLAELTRHDIKTIRGEARCRRCDTHKMIKYDIATKFQEVSNYFHQNYQHMNDRAQVR
uniref:DUF7086 domain-containing protein n=1 Tax=Oryza barthii TaxID=65489 RepID=A0A0D3GAG5_9ORYZ